MGTLGTDRTVDKWVLLMTRVTYLDLSRIISVHRLFCVKNMRRAIPRRRMIHREGINWSVGVQNKGDTYPMAQQQLPNTASRITISYPYTWD
jgi:hypothetical protein